MYTKEDVQRLLSDLGALKSNRRDGDGRLNPGHNPNLPSMAGAPDPRNPGPLPETRRSAGDPNVPERYIGNRDIDFGQPRSNLHNVDLGEVEIGEPYMFGLALDIFDPASGEVFAVCRPHMRDFGHQEVFMTPNQIAGAVANARSHRLHNERAGLIPPRPLTDEQAEEAKRRQETAKQQQAEAERRDHESRQAINAGHVQEEQRIRQRETGEVRA